MKFLTASNASNVGLVAILEARAWNERGKQITFKLSGFLASHFPSLISLATCFLLGKTCNWNWLIPLSIFGWIHSVVVDVCFSFLCFNKIILILNNSWWTNGKTIILKLNELQSSTLNFLACYRYRHRPTFVSAEKFVLEKRLAAWSFRCRMVTEAIKLHWNISTWVSSELSRRRNVASHSEVFQSSTKSFTSTSQYL